MSDETEPGELGPASTSRISSYGADPGDLAKDTIAGLGWSGLTSVARQVLQLVFQLVLARILVPWDFGLIGMVLVFGNLATVLVDNGFGSALIQRPSIEERHLRSVFGLTLGSGAAIALGLVAAAPALADFYGEPRVRGLIVIIAASYLTTSAGIVWDALAYRQLRFRVLALVDICATLGGGAVGVTCALAGMGARSLATQLFAYSFIRLMLLAATAQWRPRLQVDFTSVRELARFSLGLLGFNVLNFGARNADNLLVGRFLGSSPLGFYSRAYSLMLLPLSTITGVLSRVMFPSFSRIDDAARVKRVYLQSLSVVALFAAPLTLGLLASAAEFVPAVMGQRWLPMVPLLQILSVVGLVQTFQTTVGWIYNSRGRTDLQLRWGLAACPLIVLGFGVGIHFGTARAVAISYLVTTVVILGYPSFAIPGRLIDLKVVDVVRSVSPPIVCAVVMAAFVGLSRMIVLLRFGVTAAFAVEVLVGVVVYGACVIAFRLTAVKVLLERLPSKLGGTGTLLSRLLRTN